MFEGLARFDRVLVTGPQRSGTTICARMIAADTGYVYVDEEDIGIHYLETLRALLDERRGVVVQCPALARWVHTLDVESVLVVWMRRALVDILASQERIGWVERGEEELELSKYDSLSGPVAEVKWRFWQRVQRPRLANWMEVLYEDLSVHPLWVQKGERDGWMHRQWR